MREKYLPTERQLKIAWNIKKNKGNTADICRKLGIGPGQYAGARSVFNDYFIQISKQEQFKKDRIKPSKAVNLLTPTKKTGAYYKGGELKLNPEDINLDVLKSYVICGYNREKIAKLLGISRKTLLDLSKKSPDVYRALNNAKEELAADVLQKGLIFLTRKHKIKSTHFASYQGEIFSKTFYKKFRPDLAAIKYLLANTIGWQNESRPIAPNNKGTILAMMDEIASMDDNSNDSLVESKIQEEEKENE